VGSPLRQVVLAHGREDLDGDAVGEGAGLVGGVAGDAPAVAGLGEVGGVADGQFQAAGDEVAGLLVWMLMAGEDGALFEAKLGEEGFGAEDEGLLADFVEDGPAVSVAFWNMWSICVLNVLRQDLTPRPSLVVSGSRC
jgi:hypothetical protein